MTKSQVETRFGVMVHSFNPRTVGSSPTGPTHLGPAGDSSAALADASMPSNGGGGERRMYPLQHLTTRNTRSYRQPATCLIPRTDALLGPTTLDRVFQTVRGQWHPGPQVAPPRCRSHRRSVELRRTRRMQCSRSSHKWIRPVSGSVLPRGDAKSKAFPSPESQRCPLRRGRTLVPREERKPPVPTGGACASVEGRRPWA